MLISQAPAHLPGNTASLSRWERCVGHAGYIAEGVLYLLVGFFALLAAVGRQQQPTGSKGALAKLGGSVFGDIWLALLAIGLAAFVIWQLVLAIADPEHRENRTSPRRRVARLGHLLNGLFHTVFVGDAALDLFGRGNTDDERVTQVQWTARALTIPTGRYVVALAGASIVVFGLWQFYRAATRDKSKRMDLSRVRFRSALNVLGAFGLAARGALFVMVGGYLINAARHSDPRYAGGIPGALGGLKEHPWGQSLLGLVAAGLMCYGLYQVVKERYRRLAAKS